MLKNHTIIYDHECPMCAVYTGAFIKFELLDQNGRHDYANLTDFSLNQLIDKDRARHEIALVDTENQVVRYGLDSLFYILSNRFPVLHLLFRQKWFVMIMTQLYYFISYNRKVIAPSSKQSENSCVPDFSLKYRTLYILSMMYVIASIAIYFHIFTAFWIYWVCQVFVSFQVANLKMLFQKGSVQIHRLTQEEKIKLSITYLGHQITILLIGSLLLLPSLFLPEVLIFNLALAVMVILKEFWRRWQCLET